MMISNQKMTYQAYHNEVGSLDRRSEKAQREDIERGLDKLTEECDWWTLNALRLLLPRLSGDSAEAKELWWMLHLLRSAELEDIKWATGSLHGSIDATRKKRNAV